MERDELLAFNAKAWDQQARNGCRWSQPVDEAAIAEARRGRPAIILTPQKTVPLDWFPPLSGCPTLVLAGGGGQQTPILAAAGADVTVVDLSEEQLNRDRDVCTKFDLPVRTIQQSMDHLDTLGDAEFHLIVHPCSNSFVPDVRPVWCEAARVLAPGGILMMGCCNPVMFLFDEELLQEKRMEVRYPLPYSDLRSLPADRAAKLRADGEPLLFGHTLEDLLGGQLEAGFEMTAMYEDRWGDGTEETAAGFESLDAYLPTFLATRSRRR